MTTCASCGHSDAGTPKFCPECGAHLAAPTLVPRAARKVVTLLFCDVAGSTALGERLDPEPLSMVMASYFKAMRAVVEGHGGTVAKFIGDAVMAVFGVPVLHEDDALRAVRAAADMQRALAELNDQLRQAYGIVLETRTGVNTGELLVKDPAPDEGLVVGDAVNTAARLEQAAGPGEVLLGATTYRLVRDAVVAEPIAPISAKGKAEPVPAYRLVRLRDPRPAMPRRGDAAIVGRARERRQLQEVYRRALAGGCCQLVTVVGPAGIGKSRLVTELTVSIAAEATVLAGRCLHYGQGITFWPIGQIVAQACSIDDGDSIEAARAKVRSTIGNREHAETIAARVSELIGLAPAATGPEESFWAVRVFLEGLAIRRPLVIVFDDIQWAEPTFLDLVEHIAAFAENAPMVLVCLSRPELLDTRAAWGHGTNAASLHLDPLDGAEATQLLVRLTGQALLPDTISSRILEAADGNPLFVEEMFAMLVDDGLIVRADGHWTPTADLDTMPVPTTIAALLAARLDRLDPPERAVLECASVMGQVFWRTAVEQLAIPDAGQDVGRHLLSLVFRELIQPERSVIAGDDEFRFRHLLLRDATYSALPKADRAELHEAFTTWLERVAGARVGEYEAILGYHLEQACRLRRELGPVVAGDVARARRGASWLAKAGRRSQDQGDDRSAAGLLRRAADLLPNDDLDRITVLVDLGRALSSTGELATADTVLSDAAAAAGSTGEHCLQGRALLERMLVRVQTHHVLGDAEQLAAVWLPTFRAADDQRGLALAHRVLAGIWASHGHYQKFQHSCEQGWHHARVAGDTRQALECLAGVRLAMIYGPAPAADALAAFHVYAREVSSRYHQARLDEAEAAALATQGAIADSRSLLHRSRVTYRELGLPFDATNSMLTYLAEKAAGDAGAATDALLDAARTLETMGETYVLASIAGCLSDALICQGREEQAEHYSEQAERLADPDDIDAQVRWRRARARLLARRGDIETAELIVNEALDLVAATDALNEHANTLLDLAEVLRFAGRTNEAHAAVEQAIALFTRKGNLAMVTMARRLL